MISFAENPCPPRGVTTDEFFDFAWQTKNRITTKEQLSAYCTLTEEENQCFDRTRAVFRFAVTPYYASLIDKNDPQCPIRRQVVPRPEELEFTPSELGDPLGEEQLEAAPNVIHRYPDRVLLLVTDRCPVYCRFCTRRRIVGRTERQVTRSLLRPAISYIESQKAVREVILSGGDALMLADAQLEYLLKQLRAIDHIDIVRIATRVPVTSPMRISSRLARVLANQGPIYLMTHFNHPRECTELARDAVRPPGRRWRASLQPVGSSPRRQRPTQDHRQSESKACCHARHTLLPPPVRPGGGNRALSYTSLDWSRNYQWASRTQQRFDGPAVLR